MSNGYVFWAYYLLPIIHMVSGHKSLEAYRKFIHLGSSPIMRLDDTEVRTGTNKNGTNLVAVI